MDRIYKISYLLLKNEKPMTIDTIASKLFVSNRTIRNELIKVEELLKDNGLLLIKKPGIGVTIKGSEEAKLKFISEIRLTSNRLVPFSPEDRKNYILMKLFFDQGDTEIKYLIKELYVSRSTIKKDLVKVSKWLKGFELNLIKKSNSIIEVSGNEKNCRKAIANLVALNKKQLELKDIINEDPIKRIDYSTRTKLKETIDIDFFQLEKIIYDAEKDLKFQFSYESFINLVIHIAISIKRLNEGKSVNLSEAIISKLRNKDEYDIAKQIADEINLSFKVELPEQEIGYILLHILGAKLQQDPLNMDLKHETDFGLSLKITKEIIQITERALAMDLSNDKQLLNGLALHLKPIINRLEYDLNLRNPILDQIKESIPDLYGVAWMTNTVFQQYLGKKLNEDEVGYIAMHLAAAVERKKDLIRTLVVCTSGIGSSQLLATKLKKHFAQLDIKEISSIIEINSSKLNNIDIIISTVPMNTEKPILNISPLLTQNDIDKTINFINNLNKKDNGQLFMEDFIEINAPYCKKKDVLRNASMMLLEHGFTKEGFEKSVYSREKISRTEIGKGVALTHGFPEYVNMSQISVTIMKNPIKWVYNKVDIVFLIALTKEDIKRTTYLLRKLYKALDSEDFLNMLRKANTKAEVNEIIGNVF